MNIAKIKRRRRFMIILFCFIAISISVFLILNASRDSLIFFYSPSEVKTINVIEGKTFRLGGLVVEESFEYIVNTKVQFMVTDGVNNIMVMYEGVLPDLFREGQGVICEGKLDPNGNFIAERILAKHDENYMPPEVVDKLKETDQWQERN